jgi:hypothetical protein
MSYIVKLNRSGYVIHFLDNGDGSLVDQTKVTGLNGIFVANETAIMAYLNESLKRCFNIDYGYTTYAQLVTNDNTDYYLVFHLQENGISFELVFSTSFTRIKEENRLELYSVCKTPSKYAKDFRVSHFLYNVIITYFREGYSTVWLGVLFSNPNYERAVMSYLRAGFEIKYVASLGSGEKSNYEGRILVMEAYAGKRAFLDSTRPYVLPTDEEQKLLTIANNIKFVEYDALAVSTVMLQPSAWKIFMKQVVVKNKECGGIVRKKVMPDGTVNIDKYSILMACEGGEGQEEEQCTTTQVFPYEINFHTHPIVCYNKLQGVTAALGPPSVADLRVVFGQFLQGLRYFHMVASLEGIYIVQVHPYWQYLLENNKISEHCVSELDTLINSIHQAYFPPSYFTDIGETLKYTNNLLSPNLILKRYMEKTGASEGHRSFKERCLLQGVNRNINLFICTFVQYPIKTETTGGVSMLEYIKILKGQKVTLEQMSLDQRASAVKTFLDNGFLELAIQIPFYSLNPAMIDRLQQFV